MINAFKRLIDYPRRLPVRWTTVAVFAIVLAYVDGFWLTALQGTIGAIELNEPPFMHWLRDSTLMLPLVFLAVLLALLGARRWFAGRRRALVGLGAAALLIALISGGIGIAEVGASSFIDYQYQKHHLELIHSYGVAAQAGAATVAGFGPATNGFGPAASLTYTLYCNLRGVAAGSAVTLLEYATLMVHVRALYISTLVLLSTNLVIAAMLLLLLKDRLWSPRLMVSPQANETSSHLAAGGALV